MLSFNQTKIDGENNIVIQIIDCKGENIELSLQEVLNPIAEPYKQQIDILKKTIEDKVKIESILDKEVLRLSAKVESLENEKSNIEKQVILILEELDGKDLGKSNNLYNKAYQCFIDGDIDQAISVLDDAKMEAEEKEMLEGLKQRAETRILKARLLTIKNDFDEAGKNYERALELYKDWKSALEVGNFFRLLGKFEKAKNYYQTSLNKSTTENEKIISLNNLALVLIADNKFKDADNLLNEALQLSRNWKNIKSDFDLANIGMILHSFGFLCSERNEFLRAKRFYGKALEIRKQLAEVEPEKYLYSVAKTTNSLGVLNMDLDYESAKEYLCKAEEIIEGLAKNVSKNFFLKLAETQRNIALLESKNTNKTKVEVEELYFKALDSFYKLPDALQKLHKSFIAGFYNNLGLLQKNNNELTKAETSFQNVLNVSRELAKENPHIYLPEVAGVLHNLGNNFAEKGDFGKAENFAKAENHLKEALDITKEFAALVPEKYEIPLAKAYLCLGDLYSFNRIKNEKLFKKYVSKSIKLFEKYADSSPEAKRWGIVAKNILGNWERSD